MWVTDKARIEIKLQVWTGEDTLLMPDDRTFIIIKLEFSLCLSRLQTQLVSMRMWVQSLASLSIAMSCGIGYRHSSDPALLWLWCRPAAEAPIGPRAWELQLGPELGNFHMLQALKSKEIKNKIEAV